MKNYSDLGVSENTRVTSRPLTELLETPATPQKLSDYLSRTKRENNPYFDNLLEEFACYFYRSSRHAHTTAFLHLYRILEYVSYSFPLSYASISREYYGSFEKLKNYFDTSRSELLFFDEFTKKLLDDSLLETPLTIRFNSLHPELNRNHYRIVKTILTNDRIDGFVRHVSITTSYEHLLKLTVDLRNRYFHFAVGGKRNIRSTEILENDLFFSIINEELCNWLAIIYFNILTVSVAKT